MIANCNTQNVTCGLPIFCDLIEGHAGTRHSGCDATGNRWEWDAPVKVRTTVDVALDRITRHMDHTFGKEEHKGMIPTVGRIVHYTNLGDRDGRFPPEIQAAVITKVTERAWPADAPAPNANEETYCVSLHIFYEMGDFKMKDVPFTSEPAGSEGARGKWAWPAKV